MDEYLNEKEQWERLLASLRENAPWMIAGVAVVAVAFGGWHLWEARQDRRALEAAALYQQALAAFTRNDLDGGLKIADRVVQEFGGSAMNKWNEFTRFLRDVRAEMRKVVAPSRKEVRVTTSVVVITVFIFGVYFFLTDLVFRTGMNALLKRLGGMQ